jgi:hypothetical protein
MGDEISKETYDAKDFRLFQHRLDQETEFVRRLFAEKRFDNRRCKIGYELELCLLDSTGQPAPLIEQVLDNADNPLFTYELAKFNLEINGNAFDLQPDVFDQIELDLNNLYLQVKESAAKFDLQPGLFGVLPSLEKKHLDSAHYMSDQHRYHLLDQRLIEMRNRPVKLEIQGDELLQIEKNDVMLEALSTSLQTHLQIPFDEAVDSYHAALWASMAVLAVGANSPLVLGKHCWQESRIAIFKQAVDTRNEREVQDAIIPRVHFGKGYIDSWLDLFEDNSYYSPILPEVKHVPTENLQHFNMHNGTIWRWIRPILGVEQDLYHLRLELRVTPSGPTQIDTMANMVFFIGLLEGLKLKPEELTRVPFATLEQDFYRVAREGLRARVNWCDGEVNCIQTLLLKKALPTALIGLQQLGIENPQKWLDIIQARVASGRTGADWILRFHHKNNDLNALVLAYLANAKSNRPVHLWPKI